eukprot:9292839-Prorocentrum_lima.AAC.1
MREPSISGRFLYEAQERLRPKLKVFSKEALIAPRCKVMQRMDEANPKPKQQRAAMWVRGEP